MADAPKVVKLFTIAELWADYARLALPPDASAIQVQECRRAFYSGAYSVYVDLTFGIGHPDVPEKVSGAHLEKLHEELQAFLRDVVAHKGG